MPINIDQIRSYPQDNWHEAASPRWLTWCTQLHGYDSVVGMLEVTDCSRKWQLVSAYQKSVRRGLTDLAMSLAATLISLGSQEWAYGWRRICVTGAEDVGWADPELMNFIVACSMVYRQSAGADVLKTVWLFLTEQMCQTTRSRIYCQLSAVEDCIRKEEVPCDLTDWERAVVQHVTVKWHPLGDSLKAAWAVRNDWRAERLLKFQATVTVPFQVEVMTPDVKYELLCGLPDFSYDTHTRVGKVVCNRLCGHGPIKQFLTTYGPEAGKGNAIGWALFFAEGGRIANGLEDPRLSLLEAKCCARKFGWTLAMWQTAVQLVSEAVASGKVNEIRKSVLLSKGY